jgi:hypothetical protein
LDFHQENTKEHIGFFFDPSFIPSVKKFYTDYKGEEFVDGSSKYGFDENGAERFRRGEAWAKKNYKRILAGLEKGEKIKLVGHSEGAAFAAGIANYFIEIAHLKNAEYVIESILYLSPDEADEFYSPREPISYRIHNVFDPISPSSYRMYTDYYLKLMEANPMYAHGSSVTSEAINKLVRL